MSQAVSFVSVTRNDNYGGRLLDRVYNYTRSITHAAEQMKNNVEILFVEWNPPQEKEKIRSAIDWPEIPENVEVRFIEVPPEIHKKLEGSEEMPVFEYVGKNVGVRRTTDGPVVVTNPDLIYNNRLVRQIPELKIENSFYRVNRYDIDEIPDREIRKNQLFQFCRKHTYAVQNRYETAKPGPAAADWVKNYAEYIRDTTKHRLATLWPNSDTSQRFDPPELFTHVAGDFILTDRDNWIHLRGFPETEFNWGIDRLMVLNMANSGLQQRILGDNYRVYHQEHKNMHTHRPQPDLDEMMDERVGDEERPVWQPNGEDWGLVGYELPEQRL